MIAPAETLSCPACGGWHERSSLIMDKYFLLDQLGSGGMGNVYLACHVVLGCQVAIKFLNEQFVRDATTRQRFLIEARAPARLNHPNLVRVIDFGTWTGDVPFMVMERLRGKDCAKLLQEQGAFPVEQAVDVVYQACEGLGAAHADGIIHRDVKPENLFVTTFDSAEGPAQLVKVLDFGIAKVTSRLTAPGTQQGFIIGTPRYMSPEQIRGFALGVETDVWSLGVVLYELLSAVSPFDDEDFEQLRLKVVETPLAPLHRPELPPRLIEVVHRALEKEPCNRFRSMAEFALALAPFRLRQSARPSRPSRGDEATSPFRANDSPPPASAAPPAPDAWPAPDGLGDTIPVSVSAVARSNEPITRRPGGSYIPIYLALAAMLAAGLLFALGQRFNAAAPSPSAAAISSALAGSEASVQSTPTIGNGASDGSGGASQRLAVAPGPHGVLGSVPTPSGRRPDGSKPQPQRSSELNAEPTKFSSKPLRPRASASPNGVLPIPTSPYVRASRDGEPPSHTSNPYGR